MNALRARVRRGAMVGLGLTTLACAIVLCADLAAQGRGGGAQRAAAAPAAEVRSRLVQGNVWLINAGFVNVAAQIGPDGVFIVDTGTEAMGEKILTEIKRLAGDKIGRASCRERV